MLHHIDFKLGNLTIWVKKKSQKKNKFKSLFNIVNKLNANTKKKKLNQKLQKKKKGRILEKALLLLF
jgi:hypothetical protein